MATPQQFLAPICPSPHPNQSSKYSCFTYISRSFQTSHAVYIKQTAYMDDTKCYVADIIGLCVIYVATTEWIARLLWAMRLMSVI
jgi:hypothetical protein